MSLSHFFKVYYSCLFTCGLNWIVSLFSQSRSVFPVRRASLWMCSQPEASQPSRQSAWRELTTQTCLVSPLSLEAKRRAKERGRPGNRLSRKNVRWGSLSRPLFRTKWWSHSTCDLTRAGRRAVSEVTAVTVDQRRLLSAPSKISCLHHQHELILT